MQDFFEKNLKILRKNQVDRLIGLCYNAFVSQNTEEYPSPAEGSGLENRQVEQSAQGFESLFLRHLKIYRGVVAVW